VGKGGDIGAGSAEEVCESFTPTKACGRKKRQEKKKKQVLDRGRRCHTPISAIGL